jgi:hypothetical protein
MQMQSKSKGCQEALRLPLDDHMKVHSRFVLVPPNPSIERTSKSLLRKLSAAAHVER